MVKFLNRDWVYLLRDVSFFMRRGGGGGGGEGRSEEFIGGGVTFFSEPKKGGSRFFPEFNIKYFFLKRYAIIRNQSASCTTEPLFVSLSNTDLQRF